MQRYVKHRTTLHETFLWPEATSDLQEQKPVIRHFLTSGWISTLWTLTYHNILDGPYMTRHIVKPLLQLDERGRKIVTTNFFFLVLKLDISLTNYVKFFKTSML